MDNSFSQYNILVTSSSRSDIYSLALVCAGLCGAAFYWLAEKPLVQAGVVGAILLVALLVYKRIPERHVSTSIAIYEDYFSIGKGPAKGKYNFHQIDTFSSIKNTVSCTLKSWRFKKLIFCEETMQPWSDLPSTFQRQLQEELGEQGYEALQARSQYQHSLRNRSTAPAYIITAILVLLYLMQNHFALSNGIDINALLKGQLGQIKLAQIASDIGNTLAQINILKIAFITGAIWLISRWLLRLLCAGDFFLLSLLVLVASGIYAYYVQAGSSAGILYMAAAYIGAGVSLSHLQRQHLPKKYRLSLLEWLLAAALIIAINHFAQLNFKSPLTLDNFILPGVIGFVVALVLAVYRGRVYWPAPNLAS